MKKSESEVKKKNPVTRTNKTDNEYNYVEKELSEHFGTKVKVGNKKIEIKFTNDNDLNRLLEIMNIKLN